MTKESFGTSRRGEAVFVYTLENKSGAKVRVTDYGAALVSVVVPDKDGNMLDVLLGYDNVTGYEDNTCYFGAAIGRNANRIANARIEIDGTVYELDQNDNENNLHSGNKGIDTLVWEVKEQAENTITLVTKSAHLEQGFPGNMDIEVCYTLTEDNTVEISYKAVSDQDTVANFTNHSYFNLSGHASGDVLDQELCIYASNFTPVKDAKAIPTGEVLPVKGTPFDFTESKPIGRDIGSDHIQMIYGGGYDHNYILDKKNAEDFVCMAKAYSPATGITLEAFTDCIGVQFYSGNFITEQQGKQGATYQKRQGFCLESQFYPNAVNEERFPSPYLKAGDTYTSKTSYRFSVS